MVETWPWIVLAGLGAFHGLNPAMGWLFAVALGLQKGERSAVFTALPPIALGHAAAMALAVGLIALARLAVDPLGLRLLAAGCLIGFGVYRLLRGYRHTFIAGMQAGFVDLTLWSFLMATAHGAGLMIAPVLLELPADAAPHAGSHAHAHIMPEAFCESLWLGLAAVAVHTVTMLIVAGLIAWIVFQWIGLAVLRRGWINLDLLWSVALIGSGLAFLMLAGAELVFHDAPAHHAGLARLP